MPAKVSENIRADGDAGLANEVELVNQYAAPMYAPTAGAASAPRPVAGEGEDQQHQPRGGDDLAEQRPGVDANLGRDRRTHTEHRVRQQGPEDPADDLGEDVQTDVLARGATAGAAADDPVRGGDDRVEVRPGTGPEQQDQHAQPERSREAVLQQLQPHIVRR